MTYQSQAELIAAMKASAEETNRRMRFLDSQDQLIADEVGGHSVPTGVIAEIIAEVAAAYRVSELELIGPLKRHNIATARAAVYYHAHKNGYTNSAIARAMRRDQSTVSVGIRKYERMRSANA